MFCSNCGSKLVEGAKFCSNCGAPVAAAEETAFAPEEPVTEAADQEIREESYDIDIQWESSDTEAPDKAAFDKRVSFDWTSVIDESHKKPVKDLRSPWDPEPVNEINTFNEESAVDNIAVDADLMKEFDGIDVTPTTEKGRTLTFIEILKKEREEKERASREAAEKLVEKEPSDEGDSFEDFTAVQEEKFEFSEPVIEPFKTVEPVVTEGPDFSEEPAHEPMSFVKAAEDEMTDLKDAYDDAKAEVPSFELPSFWTASDDEDEDDDIEVAETAEEQFSNLDYEMEDSDDSNLDEYLSHEPESYDVDEQSVEDDYLDEEANVEDEYVEPETNVEDVYTDSQKKIDKEKLTEEKLHEELAAILAGGSGYKSSVEKKEEESADAVELDVYENLDVETEHVDRRTAVEDSLPKHSGFALQDEDEEFDRYEDGLELTTEATEEDEEYVDAVEQEMEITPEEAEAEEYFADMIGAVTDKANDPLADAEELRLEDIFDDEYLKGNVENLEESEEEVVAEEEEKPTDRESEIEALKRRLAELLSEQEAETEVAENPDSLTIEELFSEPEEDDVVELINETDEVELELPAEITAEEELAELTAVEPESVSDEDDFELMHKNEALEDLADIQSDAMSIEDLEKDLFGEAAFSGEGEAEATRKIDKFYTLYKKNEEFQKLLDDEYNRIQFPGEDETSELSDATITQLDNLVLPAEELERELNEEKTAEKEPLTNVEDTKAVEVEKTEEVAEVAPEGKAAPVEEETLSPKEAKKAAKAAKKAAQKEGLEMEDEEEEAGTALTVIAVIIAILLVILLAAILILNFAPDSAIGIKLDQLVQSISAGETFFDGNDGFLL